jgi:hypothetical protein
MSSDVIARLESLLSRVVARRALPRMAAPVQTPVVATSPAPKPIAPEPLKPEAPRIEARRPEAPKPVAEAPKPAAVEAPKPVAEAPKPAVVEAPKPAVVEAPKPAAPAEVSRAIEVPIEPTLVSRRILETPAEAAAAPKTSLPAAVTPPPENDRIAASFAAGVSVSPGFGEDEADHVETLAFRVGRALPKVSQVPAPPLPITTAAHREESAERRSERFTPSMPVASVAAVVTDAAPRPAASSLRSLLQRSVALRPRG